MVSKKLMYFYHTFFGLNSIVSIIASIYGIFYNLIYLIDLFLTLSLIGLYFYIFFRKNDYIGPFSQFFMFYGFINLLLLWDLRPNWPFWPFITIGIINFSGIIIYYFINSRRTRRKNR